MSAQLISGRFYAFRMNSRDNWTVFDCETEETTGVSSEVTESEIHETLSGGDA